MPAMKMKELLDKYKKPRASFQNLTSRTHVAAVEMCSLSNKGCILLLPVNSCSSGHQVLLQIEMYFGPRHSKKNKIEVTGHVKNLNVINERIIEVEIELAQFVKEEWHMVLEHFEARQEEINELIQRLKKR